MKHLGFTYQIRHQRKGRCLHVQRVPNLMPAQGINHMFDVEFHGATQVTSWFIGICEGDFTPVNGTTMALLPSQATECTAYDEATRQAWTEAAAAGGAITNAAAEAVFTINATKTIYAAFLSSGSVKGNTSGILASVTRFDTPRPCIAGDKLFVEVPFSLISTE
jgi:hypothetical protein